MKPRIFIYAVAALAVATSSGALARKWLGNDSVKYSTLAECQQNTQICTPVGRLVRVNDISEVAALETRSRQAARLARGAAAEPVIYYRLVTRPGAKIRSVLPPVADENQTPGWTHTCHNGKNNTYHKPRCAESEVEMLVKDF